MNEHFLTYEQSLAVKELGFDEYCMNAYYYEFQYKKGQKVILFHEPYAMDDYDEICSAPLKSQFFKWVREKYWICPMIDRSYRDLYEFRIVEKGWGYTSTTYEEAEDACINKIIELLKANMAVQTKD